MIAANQLNIAIDAAKKGQRDEAREILLALVEEEPQHELAWLWLSDLMPDLENRIIALENVLTLNPHRTKARQRLTQLYQQQTSLNTDSVAAAQDHAVNGRRQHAYALLQQQLQKTPDDADAWFAFSQLVEDVDDQIIALQYVMTLNPTHARAQYRLTQLQLAREDMIGLGRAYEIMGDLDHAIKAYQLAYRLSTTSAIDRTIARKRLEIAKKYRRLHRHVPHGMNLPELEHNQMLARGRDHEEQEEWDKAIIAYKTAVTMSTSMTIQKIAQKRLTTAQIEQNLPPIKLVSPTLTAVRLSLGPFILYNFLLFLHAGLHPWHIPPLLALSNLSVLVGSLIWVIVTMVPHHTLTQKLLGEPDHINSFTRALLNILGSLLIVLPFLLLFLSTLTRLTAFTPQLPAP